MIWLLYDSFSKLSLKCIVNICTIKTSFFEKRPQPTESLNSALIDIAPVSGLSEPTDTGRTKFQIIQLLILFCCYFHILPVWCVELNKKTKTPGLHGKSGVHVMWVEENDFLNLQKKTNKTGEARTITSFRHPLQLESLYKFCLELPDSSPQWSREMPLVTGDRAHDSFVLVRVPGSFSLHVLCIQHT